jgi:hypothetical protein
MLIRKYKTQKCVGKAKNGCGGDFTPMTPGFCLEEIVQEHTGGDELYEGI